MRTMIWLIWLDCKEKCHLVVTKTQKTPQAQLNLLIHSCHLMKSIFHAQWHHVDKVLITCTNQRHSNQVSWNQTQQSLALLVLCRNVKNNSAVIWRANQQQGESTTTQRTLVDHSLILAKSCNTSLWSIMNLQVVCHKTMSIPNWGTKSSAWPLPVVCANRP